MVSYFSGFFYFLLKSSFCIYQLVKLLNLRPFEKYKLLCSKDTREVTKTIQNGNFFFFLIKSLTCCNSDELIILNNCRDCRESLICWEHRNRVVAFNSEGYYFGIMRVITREAWDNSLFCRRLIYLNEQYEFGHLLSWM